MRRSRSRPFKERTLRALAPMDSAVPCSSSRRLMAPDGSATITADTLTGVNSMAAASERKATGAASGVNPTRCGTLRFQPRCSWTEEVGGRGRGRVGAGNKDNVVERGKGIKKRLQALPGTGAISPNNGSWHVLHLNGKENGGSLEKARERLEVCLRQKADGTAGGRRFCSCVRPSCMRQRETAALRVALPYGSSSVAGPSP